MKYAREVIALLAAYPERGFRMVELVRHVANGVPETKQHRDRCRKGVLRVVKTLAEEGFVKVEVGARGASGSYSWKK